MKLYAISGLGADERVFDYLKLEHELIHIPWISPEDKEPIENYAKRLITLYDLSGQVNFGILGLSFGGLIATEISKLTHPNCTILISSVQNRSELPLLFRWISKTNLIEILPEKLFNPPRALAHFVFGTSNKRILDSILNDADLYFTKWAVRELINWKNEKLLTNVINLGGAKDKLLPVKGKNAIIIEGGEHFMIVDKAKEVSKVLNTNINKYRI